MWNKIVNIKEVSDNELVNQVALLLELSPEDVRNLPIEVVPRPRLKIALSNEDLWNLLSRVYVLSDYDLGIY